MDNEIINNIVKMINESNSIYIAGHVNPDGDAVGACFALAKALESKGVKPVVLLEKFSDKFNILNGGRFLFEGDIKSLEAPELFVSLDAGSADRLGDFLGLFEKAGRTVNIDHHITNTNFADINYITAASSTCEAIYPLIARICDITPEIAEALYAGIIYDTGCFRYDSVTPETMQTAAELIKTGFDFPSVQREIMYAHTQAEARIFGRALNCYKTAENGAVIYTSITKDDMAECGSDYSDLDGIVEYLLNIRGAKASVLFTERENGVVKASFRSLRADVSALAATYGGGGHALAAGANVTGGIDNVVEDVINKLCGVIRR